MELKYNDHETRYRQALSSLEKSDLSGKYKDLIIRFVRDSISEGISKSRASKYIYYMIKLLRWLEKDPHGADKEDIKSVVGIIAESRFADFTKAELRMLLRKFFKWLRRSEDYPPEVKWIKVHMKKLDKLKMPEELLTEDEIKAMVKVSRNERDRALIAVLYESGCRIGEILQLRIRHIAFDEYGAQIRVTGKTGGRRIRLVSSVPFLQEWFNKHPCPENPDSPVWLKTTGEILQYSGVRAILSTTAKRAGIRKRIHPHLFRHSRATYLANHLTEAQMKEVFGWVQASDMAGVYVHLSGRDVDNALLRVYGIEAKEDKKESSLKVKTCERCHAENPYSSIFCSRCGLALDENTRLNIIRQDMERRKADSVLDELIRDREFREVFIRKLQYFEFRHQNNFFRVG